MLTGIAGLTVLLRSGGGLYWLIPAVLAGLVGGVINAWLPAQGTRRGRNARCCFRVSR